MKLGRDTLQNAGHAGRVPRGHAVRHGRVAYTTIALNNKPLTWPEGLTNARRTSACLSSHLSPLRRRWLPPACASSKGLAVQRRMGTTSTAAAQRVTDGAGSLFSPITHSHPLIVSRERSGRVGCIFLQGVALFWRSHKSAHSSLTEPPTHSSLIALQVGQGRRRGRRSPAVYPLG
jgi:hypothetical protein